MKMTTRAQHPNLPKFAEFVWVSLKLATR